MRILETLKIRIIQTYNFIKELERMPLQFLSEDGDYETKPEPPKAKRTNPVKVEDLRPPGKSE